MEACFKNDCAKTHSYRCYQRHYQRHSSTPYRIWDLHLICFSCEDKIRYYWIINKTKKGTDGFHRLFLFRSKSRPTWQIPPDIPENITWLWDENSWSFKFKFSVLSFCLFSCIYKSLWVTPCLCINKSALPGRLSVCTSALTITLSTLGYNSHCFQENYEEKSMKMCVIIKFINALMIMF